MLEIHQIIYINKDFTITIGNLYETNMENMWLLPMTNNNYIIDYHNLFKIITKNNSIITLSYHINKLEFYIRNKLLRNKLLKNKSNQFT